MATGKKKKKRPAADDESSSSSESSSDDDSRGTSKHRSSQARGNTSKKEGKEMKRLLAVAIEEMHKLSNQATQSKEEVCKQLDMVRGEMCQQSKQATQSKEEMYKQLEKVRQEMCQQSKQVAESKEEICKQLEKVKEDLITKIHDGLCKQWELHTNGTSGDAFDAPRSQSNQVQTPRYRLVFKSGEIDKICKGELIDISVALVDGNDQTVENGPLASATVELVVVNAEFNQHNNLYNWSREHFEGNIKKAQGNSATVDVDQSVKSIVSDGRFNLVQGFKCYSGSKIFSNSGNKKVRLAVMVVSPTEERVLEGLSNPFFVRGHDRPARQSNWRHNRSNMQRQGLVDNGCQEQISPMPNMQNPSLANPTQAGGTRLNNATGGQLSFQRHTTVLSIEPSASQDERGLIQQYLAQATNNETGLDIIGQSQLPPYIDPYTIQQALIPHNQGPHRQIFTQPMKNQTGTQINMDQTTFPVQSVWDMPNVEPSKRLDALMSLSSSQPKFNNFSLSTMGFTAEHFSSLMTIIQKQEIQTRRKRGVLVELLEHDNSDEERPLKRKVQSKYRLRFINKVCKDYYILDQIKADDQNLLKVALFDDKNTKITSGPLSSASVEILALHGDFNGNGQDYWTSEEFSRSVVCPSPGEEASSVLAGDRILVLAGGEACLGDTFFQKTSFCARTGMFKMGVMLASAQEERIQEGISEPFRVMDHHLPGFISNCWSWKSDLEPPLCQASTRSARMTEAVLLAASKIGSILTEEATKADISKLSEKVVNLKELPRKIEEIGKELNMIDKVIKQIGTTSLTNELVKGSISEVRDLGYDVEDVIDSYSYYAIKLEEENRVKKIFSKAQYITVFSEIAEKITQIEDKLENVVKRKDQWLQQSQLSPILFTDIERKRIQDCILDVVQDDLVGIEENRRLLTEWLNSEEQSTKLITVSGMGGLGKTTLVKNLYEQEKNNFTAHAWIDVSQTYNVVELLRELLRKIEDTQQPQLQDLDAYDLKQKIKERLTDRKCLIVLDDIWNQDAYTQMRDAFENQASCVIITTRQEQVAALAHPTHQLKLKPLGYSDAFLLFCRKAFYSCMDSKCPSELEKLANNIVDMCQGLPLAIVIMGGLLSALPPVKDVWNDTYKQFQNEMKNNDQVRAILNLNYNDLPGNLRNCFLYCSLFPEDYLMSRESLVRLWVAEGFVVQNDQSTPEEVADKYLRELIQRNMLEAVENDGLGRVSTCKMHDLVRDLALSISREEMYGFARNYGTMVKMDKSVRRLSSCGWKDKTSSSLKVKIQLPRLRTLVAHGITESSPQLLSSVLSESMYLGVLDLQDSEIVEVPASIGNLFNLRYIGLRGTRVKSLPESISNLFNLQTLDLKETKIEKLPRGIAGVKKLRHLLVDRYPDENQSEFRYFIGVQAPKGLSKLEELQTLETVEASKDFNEQLPKLKKLRSVWIHNIISIDCAKLFTALSKMPVLSSLLLSASDEKETLCLEALKPESENLHKLIIRGCWADKTLECSTFQEHGRNLKYLAISWCHFQEDPLQLLAPCVPNLTYLSLNRVSSANTLVLPPGCFPQLKTLVLKRMPCVDEVEIRVGALRQIEGLCIESLVNLDKIPQGIEFLCSLKKLWLLDLHKEFRAQWNSKGMPQKMNYVRDLCI